MPSDLVAPKRDGAAEKPGGETRSSTEAPAPGEAAPKPKQPPARLAPARGEESSFGKVSPSEASNDSASSSDSASSKRSRSQRRRRGRGRNRRLPDVPVVLVGPMAAGKTSLGKRLARELGVPFADSDAIFSREHGSITEFFAKHGEAEFRRIEAEIIAAELRRGRPGVLSLGGGAVLDAGTRELLQNHPVILLLTTERAVRRTANLRRRPLLRDDPGAWQRILDERRPLYEEVANVTYRTDRATKEQLAERASMWVYAQGRKKEYRIGDVQHER